MILQRTFRRRSQQAVGRCLCRCRRRKRARSRVRLAAAVHVDSLGGRHGCGWKQSGYGTRHPELTDTNSLKVVTALLEDTANLEEMLGLGRLGACLGLSLRWRTVWCAHRQSCRSLVAGRGPPSSEEAVGGGRTGPEGSASLDEFVWRGCYGDRRDKGPI